MTVLLICPMKKEYHCAREALSAAEIPFSETYRLSEKNFAVKKPAVKNQAVKNQAVKNQAERTLKNKKGDLTLHILNCGFSPEDAIFQYTGSFGTPDFMIDSGSCGALSDDFEPGDILTAWAVMTKGADPVEVSLSPECEESGAGNLKKAALIEVSEPVSGGQERSRLALLADACTMESYRICTAAQEMKTRFCSFRVVTDRADGNMQKDFRKNLRPFCLSLYKTVGEFLNDLSH